MKLFVQIFVLTTLSLVSLFAFGQTKLTPVNPGVLLVSLDEVSAKEIINAGDFKSFCEGIGPKLTIDNGVFGLGVFTEVKCTPESPNKGDNLIRLGVGFEGAEAILSIELATLKNSSRRLAGVRFKHAGKFKEMMNDVPFATLVAFSLLDQLPFQMVMKTGESIKKLHTLTDAERTLLAEGVQVPASMLAFNASIDDAGLFYPNSHGVILSSLDTSKSAYLHESSANKGGSIVWKISTKSKKLPGFVLGVNADGRSAFKGQLEKMIAERASQLEGELKQGAVSKGFQSVAAAVGNLGSSGYLGLRYGPALLPGDLIDQSKYFGALVEFRSGLLDGLRMYYDYWPEVKGTINGQEGTFGGKRAIVAYSFALKFESWIRKIDLTPKAGIWSFRSKAPIELEPGVYVSPEFVVKRAPSFDIEMGIETGSSVHILRGWASRAASILNKTSKDGAKISSTRVGMDLLLSPWGATNPVTFSLLSFYFFESVGLEKTQNVEDNDAQLDELSYSQAYAGAGIAVSW